MTAVAMKTQTKEIIDTLDDKQIELVFDYLQQFLKEYEEKEEVRQRKMRAFERMEKMVTKVDLPEDFDYKKEMAKIYWEKYESIK